MNASDLREVFETVLPEEALRAAVEAAGLQERERKLSAQRLLRAMVIAAATGYGGRQADVMRLYFELGAERVVRGGFYAWFGKPLEAVMESIRDRALAYAAAQPCDLPGWLGEHVRDWHIVDSSTVKLDARLRREYPGAGDYAALKVHKRFSVGIGTAIDYHLSPAREHDAPHLTIDESWRGLGLLADLGYASLKLLRDCASHEVRYVIRLKENWKPRVQSITRGCLTRTFAAGSDLDLLLAEEILVLDGSVLDARVEVGEGQQRVACRLVGVPSPEGEYCFYLTNLPGVVGPRQIADLYRVRWEIGVSGEGHIVQSVKVRPGPRDSSPVAWEAPWRESKTAKPSDNGLDREVAQRTRLQRTVNAEVASLHSFPVAETVYNARRQQGPVETSLTRRPSPAGYQRWHGAKEYVSTGEALGTRRGKPVEEARPITVSGKWVRRYPGGGSGRSTVDGRAAKRARREGPGPRGITLCEARQG